MKYFKDFTKEQKTTLVTTLITSGAAMAIAWITTGSAFESKLEESREELEQLRSSIQIYENSLSDSVQKMQSLNDELTKLNDAAKGIDPLNWKSFLQS